MGADSMRDADGGFAGVAADFAGSGIGFARALGVLAGTWAGLTGAVVGFGWAGGDFGWAGGDFSGAVAGFGWGLEARFGWGGLVWTLAGALAGGTRNLGPGFGPPAQTTASPSSGFEASQLRSFRQAGIC